VIVSGAFGLFRRDVVDEVGGYWTDTVGEDLELGIARRCCAPIRHARHAGTVGPRGAGIPQRPPRPRSRPHVGIYLGDGRFIHAPHTGDHVRVSSLAGGWYAEHYDGATRVA
jgi:hypothetical protein